MTFGNIGLALALGPGMAAATLGSVAQAGDHREASKAHRRAAAGMQAVAVSPKAGDPAHGWRHFSDARATRADGCRLSLPSIRPWPASGSLS